MSGFETGQQVRVVGWDGQARGWDAVKHLVGQIGEVVGDRNPEDFPEVYFQDDPRKEFTYWFYDHELEAVE